MSARRDYVASLPDKRVSFALDLVMKLLEPTRDDTAITAKAGGGQSGATALKGDVLYHEVTTVATAADSVALPAAIEGAMHFVKNSAAANSMQVFGSGTDTIDSVATATGVPQAAGEGVMYFCAVTGNYTRLRGVGASPTFTNLALTGNLSLSATNAITAFATGGQTSAVAITTDFARVTVCATAGDSVKLPTATAGREVCLVNVGAAAADVFPATGDAINNLAVNLAVRQKTGSTVWYTCHVAGTWSTQLQLPDAQYVKNTTVGATTAAAGDMTGARYVQAEYSAVGAANLTTRTAAQIIADGFLQIGDSYVLEITNTSGGTTTLTAGTGVTLTGTMTMATNTTRRFNVKVTGAATVTIQSTGVGTIS
jgi:hypothetical protein